MLLFDHAIVLTPDPDETASWLFEEHGLASVQGGRHPGHGTANLIVPLGPDYLELMYVADEDEANSSPIGRWALSHMRDEASVAALMVRVPSVTPHALRLELPIVEANRTRDDGVELTWRMTGLERGFSEDPLPIFIECAMPMQHHPGRDEADHRTQPHGIAWVEFGADSAELGRWLGSHDLDIRVDEAASGPTRVGVSTADGEIVI